MMPFTSSSDSRRIQNRTLILLGLFVGILSSNIPAQADDFVVRSRGGEEEQLEGEVTFENDQLVFSMATDGHVMRIEKNLILKRTPAPPPGYLAPDDLHQYLLESFGIEESKLRWKVTPDCLVYLSLERPLPNDDQTKKRVNDYLTRIVQVYQRSAKGVEAFAKQQGLKQKRPPTPAVIFMIESPSVAHTTFQFTPGIQAPIRFLYRDGWYDPYYNIAKFRMDDVIAKDEKMGELLVFQLLFHTGIFNRPAPVPLWLMAALSAGFEEDATQLKPVHHAIPPHFISIASMDLDRADWNKLVADYASGKFTIVDGEHLSMSRAHVLTLHWYLMTQQKAGYARYLELVSALTPLDDPSPEKVLADFKQAFGKEPNAFKEFVKRPPPKIEATKSKLEEFPFSYKQSFGFAKAKASFAAAPFNRRIEGELTNISPFRSRTYGVGITTSGGSQIVWFLNDLKPGQTAKLEPKDVKFLESASNPMHETESTRETAADKPATTKAQREPATQPVASRSRTGKSGTGTEKKNGAVITEKPSSLTKKAPKPKEKAITKTPSQSKKDVGRPESIHMQSVWVISVPNDSAEADKWRQGEMPFPMIPKK